MKFRKPASAMLAAAMLVSSVSIVSYAEEDEAMKKELTYVKQRVEIPEELSKFVYSKSENNGRKTYTFTWSVDPDSGKEWQSLTVSICENVITRYEFQNDKSWRWGENYSFGKLSKETLLKKADKALKKLNPSIYKYLEINKDNVYVSLGSQQATIGVKRVKDGVPVSGHTGSITLDKDTGELLSYRLSWIFGAGFRDVEDAVSVKKAQEGYKETFPISKLYTANYDWKEKKYEPHLIYKRDTFGQIDAFTGKLATFEDSYGYYDAGDYDSDDDDDMAAAEAVAADNGAVDEVSFTDKELEMLEQEGRLIKPDEQLKAIYNAKIYNIAPGSEITYSYTNYSTWLGAYVCSFNFKSEDNNYYSIDDGEPMPIGGDDDDDDVDDDVIEDDDGSTPPKRTQVYYGYCSYNAETGEVLSYNATSPDDNKILKNEKTAERSITRALSRIAGDKAREFRTDNIDYHYTEITAANGSSVPADEKDAKGELRGASLNSPRYAYDIPCSAERVNISINGAGKVSYYNITYYGIEYPAPDNIITPEEAYDKYFEQIDYSLLYRCALHEKKVETALVYNASDELYIDAFSGKLTNSNGVERIMEKKASGYTDLEGSKYGKIAEKLALYGIYLMDENGRLNETAPISRAEFANLIRNIGCYCSYENGDKELTRQYAAKLLTMKKLSEDVAEIPGLFNCKYSDVTNIKYIAYVALADALGFMSGKDGKFRPNDLVTRGEALKIVYDYLSA